MIVRPGDEYYPVFVHLATLIAAYMNAHVHFDLASMGEVERLAEVARLKAWFEELTH